MLPAVMNAVRVSRRIAREWPDPGVHRCADRGSPANRSTCYNILGTLQRGRLGGHRGTGALVAGAPAVGDRRRFRGLDQ